FLPGHAMLSRMAGVDVDAIGALGGQRDAECDQLAVFARDRAVLALHRHVEGHEFLAFHWGQCKQRRYRLDVAARLVVRHWFLPNLPSNSLETQRSEKGSRNRRIFSLVTAQPPDSRWPKAARASSGAPGASGF